MNHLIIKVKKACLKGQGTSVINEVGGAICLFAALIVCTIMVFVI